MSIAFSPVTSSTTLVSTSWDKTMRIWNAVENASDHETIQLFSDGNCFNWIEYETHEFLLL